MLQKRVPTAVILCQVRRRQTSWDTHAEQEWVQSGGVSRGCSHSASQTGSITAILILFLPLFLHIIHHSHPDSVPSPLPSHHTCDRGKTAGRVALELHRHLYTQGAEVPPLWAVLYTPGLEDENILGLALPSLRLPQFHQSTIPCPFPWQLPLRRLKLLFGS